MIVKKSLITYLLSFFVCIFLAAATIGAGCYFGFLSEGSLNIAFSESKAFDDIRESILDGIDYSAVPYGMDKLVFESIINKDMVRGDVSEYISCMYSGREFETDQEAFENSYYYNVSYMFNEKNIFIDENGEHSIAAYYPQIRDYYTNAIKNINLGIFTGIKNEYSSFIIIIITAGVIGAFVCGAGIFFTAGSVSDKVQMFAFSLMGAGITTSALPSYMLLKGAYINAQVFPEYMYNITVRFLRNGLITVNGFGIFIIAAGIVCAVIDITMSSGKK